MLTEGDGWYISGDVFRRDADGAYYFVGRADDMFVCGGENIYPAEVETVLESHPEIVQACVVPVPDENQGREAGCLCRSRRRRRSRRGRDKSSTPSPGLPPICTRGW